MGMLWVCTVVGFFHEEEVEDEADGQEDGAPIEHPLPTLTVGDETCNDGGKIATSS